MQNSDDNKVQFLKRRQEFSVNMRRQNRQEIISKRRNVQPEQQEQHQGPAINYIVDSRFEDYIKKFQSSIYHLTDLPELIKAMHDSDIIKQHYGIIGIRKIMSQVEEPPIQPIIDSGIVPKIIQLMNQTQFPQLQLQSAWCLANVASGNYSQCQSIISKGVIPMFIRLLQSEHLGILEQAVWALGNIASDSSFNRDEVTRKQAIPSIINILDHITIQEIVEPSVWTLTNLCRGSPTPSYEKVKSAVLKIGQLLPYVDFKQESIFADCCWAISYNFPRSVEDRNRILTTNFIDKVVQKMHTNQYKEIVPIVRVICQLAKNGDYYIDRLLESNGRFFDAIQDLLSFNRKLVRVQTCWIISEIASGNQNHVNALLQREGIIAKLLQLFEVDDKDVRREMCFIFSNIITGGHPGTVAKFYKQVNIMRFYILCLTHPNAKLICDSLEGIYQILQFGEKIKGDGQNPFSIQIGNLNGFTILQQLQNHDDQKVYELVVKIMKEFFQLDDSLNL